MPVAGGWLLDQRGRMAPGHDVGVAQIRRIALCRRSEGGGGELAFLRSPLLVPRVVDSLMLLGSSRPSDQQVHYHEYEENKYLGTLGGCRPSRSPPAQRRHGHGQADGDQQHRRLNRIPARWPEPLAHQPFTQIASDQGCPKPPNAWLACWLGRRA